MPEGVPSGGMFDKGLLALIGLFPSIPCAGSRCGQVGVGCYGLELVDQALYLVTLGWVFARAPGVIEL